MANLSSEIWERALDDSWSVLGGAGGVIFQILTFVIAMVLVWKKQGGGEVKKTCISGLFGAAVIAAAWLLTLVAHYAVISPRALLKEKQAVIEEKPRSEKSVRVDVTGVIDTEGRKKIEELEEKLRYTLTIDPSDLDPFAQPIAAAKFTISLDLKDRKNKGGHELSDGLLMVLVADEKGLLHGTTTDHFEDSSGQRRYFVDIPFDSGKMGEAVSTLADATSIIVQFKELLMPLGTVITGGQIVMLINNQITVKFDVPGQTIQAKANNNPVIIVNDIQEQMWKVIKPLSSPTPHTAASQPSPTL